MIRTITTTHPIILWQREGSKKETRLMWLAIYILDTTTNNATSFFYFYETIRDHQRGGLRLSRPFANQVKPSLQAKSPDLCAQVASRQS